jgi:hypothetical protein
VLAASATALGATWKGCCSRLNATRPAPPSPPPSPWPVRDEWIELGVMEKLRVMALSAYDRLIGLDLSEVVVDGCATKAPGGEEKAGKSPVYRGKMGLKRSTLRASRWVRSRRPPEQPRLSPIGPHA